MARSDQTKHPSGIDVGTFDTISQLIGRDAAESIVSDVGVAIGNIVPAPTRAFQALGKSVASRGGLGPQALRGIAKKGLGELTAAGYLRAVTEAGNILRARGN